MLILGLLESVGFQFAFLYFTLEPHWPYLSKCQIMGDLTLPIDFFRKTGKIVVISLIRGG